MTIKEFFESEEWLAIHCSTEEQAKELLQAFDKEDFKWRTSIYDRYTDKTYWNEFKKNTCYSNNHGYGDIKWYKKNDYKILEFKDIEF